jgi:hypothetical protein
MALAALALSEIQATTALETGRATLDAFCFPVLIFLMTHTLLLAVD